MIEVNVVEGFFDPIEHKYTDVNGTVYSSATGIIKYFEPDVDWDYWKKEKALERNVTVADIEAEWKHKTDIALERGNNIHNELEDKLNEATHKLKCSPIGANSNVQIYNTIASLRSKDIFIKYNKIRLYLEKLIQNGYILYAEYRLFRPEIGLAGTVDLLAIKGNDIIIIDWKTNKHPILFTSGYFKKKLVNNVKIATNQFVPTLDFMKNPIDYLFNCLGTKYTLQLSIYAYMLSMYGFNIKGLVLFHIKYNNALQRDEIFTYVLDNKAKEVFKMLKHLNKL